MTGAYRFKTSFDGLKDMLAEFQQVIDCKLPGLINTFCFLDDILIVSRGRIENLLDHVRKCLIKLYQENLRINLAECHFTKREIEWLYSIWYNTITKKTDAIQQLSSPSNLKKLRSFYGICASFRQVHTKFISNVSPT